MVSFIYNINKFLSAQKIQPQDDRPFMPGMRMGGFRGGRGMD
jgi:hypothetical protein